MSGPLISARESSISDPALSELRVLEEALWILDRYADQEPSHTVLGRQLRQTRTQLLSLLLPMVPPAELGLTLRRDGIYHFVEARFLDGDTTVIVLLESLDRAARTFVTATLGCPEIET